MNWPMEADGVVPVPCGICGEPTRMTATKRCDRCWELEGHIQRDPELARKILDAMKPSPFSMTMRDILHVLRNPWGKPEGEVRAARLAAADLLEAFEAMSDRLYGYVIREAGPKPVPPKRLGDLIARELDSRPRQGPSDGERVVAACWSCNKPYSAFPLDVVLPRSQWLAINQGEEGGLLCAACIVDRASAFIPGATVGHLVFEVTPREVPSPCTESNAAPTQGAKQ